MKCNNINNFVAQFQQRDYQRNGTATFRYDEVSYHNNYITSLPLLLVYSGHHEPVNGGSRDLLFITICLLEMCCHVNMDYDFVRVW